MTDYKRTTGWIGVDFDRTLAYYESTQAPDLGAPIPAMLARVKEWLAEGKDVRIFTARVSHDGTLKRRQQAINAQLAIEAWCNEHLGQRLPVTCTKDFECLELWDDRARQVEPNTGEMTYEVGYRDGYEQGWENGYSKRETNPTGADNGN